MPMRIGDLLLIIEASKIKLPKTGTGAGNKIVARDLENAIGDHFMKRDYAPGSDELKHLELRRAWTPMKAYRFNKLKPVDQASILEDNNDWVAEEKINGWRMMITFIPGTTPRFWGGNLSTVNFLPTDYTERVVLKYVKHTLPVQALTSDEAFKSLTDKPCILDCEVIVKEDGEQLSAHASLIRVQEILGSNPERARRMQDCSTLLFKVFDCINPAKPAEQRQIRRINAVSTCIKIHEPFANGLPQFSVLQSQLNDKKALVNKIWRAGGEGVVLKHRSATYIPGSRLRTHQIKVKRCHSDTIGDDIDAFISRIYHTAEWTKQGLIGGVELSVYIKTKTPKGADFKQHVIARVTSIPDDIRRHITWHPVAWAQEVVVCDGQDLSARNMRLLHAKVDWERGVRKDKNAMDCVMELGDIEGVKF